MNIQSSNLLKINKLSKAQFDREKDAANLDPTALYLIPEEAITFTAGGSGADPGVTFDGSVARTISWNTVGAAEEWHIHGNITNAGTLGAANKVVVTDATGKISASSVIDTTELGRLNGVTSNIQTQLDGKLDKSGGGTVTGTLILSKTQDLSGTANNSPALIVGGDSTSTHLELDCDEIQAKTNGTSTAQLYINREGGCTNFGGGILVKGNIVGQTDSTGYATISGFTSVSAGSFTATSDKRLKENIESYTCANSILDLDVKKFDFIKGAKNQIGCIAQDLQEICPEIVSEDKDGYLAIQESKIVYLLLDEVKKLKAEVERLNHTVASLTSTIR